MIKEAEHWRVDAFKLWSWRRLADCKEIKSVNPKGNQPWIFIGRTHAEAEAPILWLPDVKTWLIGKDPDAGKNWKQKEKGVVEDEMVRIQTVRWNSSTSEPCKELPVEYSAVAFYGNINYAYLK